MEAKRRAGDLYKSVLSCVAYATRSHIQAAADGHQDSPDNVAILTIRPTLPKGS